MHLKTRDDKQMKVLDADKARIASILNGLENEKSLRIDEAKKIKVKVFINARNPISQIFLNTYNLLAIKSLQKCKIRC